MADGLALSEAMRQRQGEVGVAQKPRANGGRTGIVPMVERPGPGSERSQLARENGFILDSFESIWTLFVCSGTIVSIGG